MKASDLFVKALEAEGVEYIFGIPGETLDDQESALRFYAESGADVVKPFFMTYFPGTDLTKRAEQEHAAAEGDWDHFMFEGRLSGDDYRPWNLAYSLFPMLGPRGRRVLLDWNLHHRLAPVTSLPGMGNVILFPRLLTGLLGDSDIRPRLYLNYVRTIVGYKLRNRLLP